MEAIFVCIIVQLSVYCIHAYDGSNQRHTIVPHTDIQDSETNIDLQSKKNSLSELLPNEFTAYTELTVLNLRRNVVQTISPSAFTGTQLQDLDLLMNKLTIAPDLTAVSGTLNTLSLRVNPLTVFPNVSMHGSDAKLSLNS